MKRIFVIMLCFLVLLSCQQNGAAGQSTDERQVLLDSVQLQREALKKAFRARENMEKTAEGFSDLAERFADRFPQDSLSPVLLFEAADVAGGAGEPGLSIKLWGRVQRYYPEYEKAPDALFMQAFVFETMIGDKHNARRYYQQFLKRFPEHPLAETATLALKTLEKSPEELIREFEDK